MKRKAIAAAMITAMAVSIPVKANPLTGIYPATWIVAKIREIETSNDAYEEILCVDAAGREWAFYSDAGDWVEDDLVAVIMDGCGTPCIYDDVIVCPPFYAGTTELLIKAAMEAVRE